jgi:hypothetical protein
VRYLGHGFNKEPECPFLFCRRTAGFKFVPGTLTKLYKIPPNKSIFSIDFSSLIHGNYKSNISFFLRSFCAEEGMEIDIKTPRNKRSHDTGKKSVCVHNVQIPLDKVF